MGVVCSCRDVCDRERDDIVRGSADTAWGATSHADASGAARDTTIVSMVCMNRSVR